MEIGLLMILLIAYFVPAATAMARSHHNTGAIVMLNLFLGWTFIGWVVALVWACTATHGTAPVKDNAQPVKDDSQDGY